MRKIIYLIIFLLVFTVGLAFAVLNSQIITFNYYFDSIGVSLSLAIVLAILLGAMLGIMVSLIMVLRLRQEVARLRRSLQLVEKQNSEFRSQQTKM